MISAGPKLRLSSFYSDDKSPGTKTNVRALQAAPGHSLPEEYFKSQLEEHFGENEAEEQLETAINWGALRRTLQL